MCEDDYARSIFRHDRELFLQMLRTFFAKFPQPGSQVAGPEFRDQIFVIEGHAGGISITGRGVAPATAPAKIDALGKLDRLRLASGLENEQPGPLKPCEL